MAAAGRRSPGAWFKRAGTPLRVIAVCLTAILLVGLALIADGLMMKVENDHDEPRRTSTLLSNHDAARYGAPIRHQ
ncbi:hypothetical protein [Microbaculum marinisediminis]|uniref:Uncharacterized protein n=1 Tax=Microbaculum marinisediminis TaxID=2931392 RepID=A0AAW5R886_9HYPH|nr:hypothetical protein [Microbaculum sp. A6E488]MCT8974869.1 hypothetical protein [Microbaculum sp. A6E488]